MERRKKYIAYGSNLNLGQMARRCPTARVIGKGEIKDHELLFRGGLYNVQKLPANFLIDKEGNIVGKDIYGKSLEQKLDELTR